jgi:hypothetical protein
MQIFFLLVLAAGCAAMAIRQTGKIKKLNTRLRPIEDADKYAEVTRRHADAKLNETIEEAKGIRRQADAVLAESVEESKGILAGALQRRNDITEEINEIHRDIDIAKRDLKILIDALDLKSDDACLLEVGYYDPIYAFADLPRFEKELQRVREKQKDMLKLDGENGNKRSAAFWFNQDSSEAFQRRAKESTKRIKNILRLMLRAFNGECDAYIAKVNYRNVEAMKNRMESSFDQINKLAEAWGCVISPKYLATRQSELQLVFEYEEQKQKEKEEQAQIREQMREEQKAAREAERAKQQAEKEEAEYQEMLERAKLEAANASEEDKAVLNSKVEELQRRISEIEDKKRAISQAMLTRTGHVYILSNVGSFGENIYKIGMTRRLDPMDRVNELGDASVPFPFDVHALISTSDAPTLESSLHKHFGERRVNLENERKEFFKVSIEELKIELEQLRDGLGIESELQLTLVAEAKQYRISEAKRKQLDEQS